MKSKKRSDSFTPCFDNAGQLLNKSGFFDLCEKMTDLEITSLLESGQQYFQKLPLLDQIVAVQTPMSMLLEKQLTLADPKPEAPSVQRKPQYLFNF